MSLVKCSQCGLRYIEDSLADRKAHRTYHDETINGVRARSLKSDKVIWNADDDRVIVVTPFSPRAQRARAQRVARVANREVHHDFGIYSQHEKPDERNLHIFLHCHENRFTGLAIMEMRNLVCRYTWEEYDRCEQKEFEVSDPIWSLGFIWVPVGSRRKGIASTLVRKATAFLGTGAERIGVHPPFSEDGEQLWRSLSPGGFVCAA